jgi:hypothetical protein
MRIGVSFPTVEIGADLAVVRDFVHTAEELGYTHLRILDHVLGADPQFHPEVPVFYYTHESVTHEPFTLMAYLAARINHGDYYFAATADRPGGEAGRRSGRVEWRTPAPGYRRRLESRGIRGARRGFSDSGPPQ